MAQDAATNMNRTKLRIVPPCEIGRSLSVAARVARWSAVARREASPLGDGSAGAERGDGLGRRLACRCDDGGGQHGGGLQLARVDLVAGVGRGEDVAQVGERLVEAGDEAQRG